MSFYQKEWDDMTTTQLLSELNHRSLRELARRKIKNRDGLHHHELVAALMQIGINRALVLDKLIEMRTLKEKQKQALLDQRKKMRLLRKELRFNFKKGDRVVWKDLVEKYKFGIVSRRARNACYYVNVYETIFGINYASKLTFDADWNKPLYKTVRVFVEKLQLYPGPIESGFF